MKKKASTVKEHLERINRTLVYIQNHVNETISLHDLQQVSHFSRYHFHRIFTAYTGETVNAYVRRLRIERASRQLLYSKDSVTQVALDAGFETPSSFSKVFKKITGCTPREFRERGSLTDYGEACSDKNNIRGDVSMKPIIKTIEPQKVIFIRRSGNYYLSAPAAWIAMGNYVESHAISQENIKLIGITHDNPAITDEDNWRFDACVAGLAKPTADGEVGVQHIAGGKYAIFEHVGPYNTLGDTYREIFSQWYPNSGLELRDEPTFSLYVNRSFKTDYGNMAAEEKALLITHVYVPIE